MSRSFTLAITPALCILLTSAPIALSQCTKDTDCKGDRICVKGKCVDPSTSSRSTTGGSTTGSTTAAPPTPTAEAAPAPPSEAEVRSCVATLEDLGRLYGDVIRIEYGSSMLSQGGMAEMRLGAPSGTRLYPVRLRFRNFRTGEAWLYRDPFGSLKCTKHGDIEHRPPTTKEEMAAAIKDGETIKLPAKVLLNSFGSSPQFATGTLSIGKEAVAYRVPNPSLDFSVPPTQIYDVDTQNWQLHLHLVVYNARTRDNDLRQDVYLWDPAVQAGGRGVDCSRCGDAVSILKALINVARGKE